MELGEYDSDLDEYQIVSGLANSDYLAWPDTDCVVGAATTTEYVFDDLKWAAWTMAWESATVQTWTKTLAWMARPAWMTEQAPPTPRRSAVKTPQSDKEVPL